MFNLWIYINQLKLPNKQIMIRYLMYQNYHHTSIINLIMKINKKI